MARPIPYAAAQLEQDHSVRVVMSGEGKGFTASDDLTRMQGNRRATACDIIDSLHAALVKLAHLYAPVIAVHGVVAGAGLLMRADLALAAEGTRFQPRLP